MLTILADHDVDYVLAGSVAGWPKRIGVEGVCCGRCAQGSQPPSPGPTHPASSSLPDKVHSTSFRSWGAYEDVSPRWVLMEVCGVGNVQVMSIEDSLAQLTIPRREKDAARVMHLRQRQLRGDPPGR